MMLFDHIACGRKRANRIISVQMDDRLLRDPVEIEG